MAKNKSGKAVERSARFVTRIPPEGDVPSDWLWRFDIDATRYAKYDLNLAWDDYEEDATGRNLAALYLRSMESGVYPPRAVLTRLQEVFSDWLAPENLKVKGSKTLDHFLEGRGKGNRDSRRSYQVALEKDWLLVDMILLRSLGAAVVDAAAMLASKKDCAYSSQTIGRYYQDKANSARRLQYEPDLVGADMSDEELDSFLAEFPGPDQVAPKFMPSERKSAISKGLLKR